MLGGDRKGGGSPPGHYGLDLAVAARQAWEHYCGDCNVQGECRNVNGNMDPVCPMCNKVIMHYPPGVRGMMKAAAEEAAPSERTSEKNGRLTHEQMRTITSLNLLDYNLPLARGRPDGRQEEIMERWEAAQRAPVTAQERRDSLYDDPMPDAIKYKCATHGCSRPKARRPYWNHRHEEWDATRGPSGAWVEVPKWYAHCCRTCHASDGQEHGPWCEHWYGADYPPVDVPGITRCLGAWIRRQRMLQ